MPAPLQASSETERRQIESRLVAALTAAGVAVKTLEAYGSQVVVTVRAEAAAKRCALVLGKTFRIRGILRTMDDAVKNRGTRMLPTKVIVWRVLACTCAALPAA